MRRPAPRPLAGALERVVAGVAPATPLARVQRAWRAAVGDALAREAEPVSERNGVVTVACRSATWAQELELMGPELTRRLEEALDDPQGEEGRRALRFVTRSGAAPP